MPHEWAASRGFRIEKTGAGRQPDARNVDQENLRAPNIAALRAAVTALPNDERDYDRYVQIAAAIRAAAGPEHEVEGFEIFAEWANQWEVGPDDPAFDRTWDSVKPPHSIVWWFIAHHARENGFNSAPFEFDVVAQAPNESSSEPEYISRFNRKYAKVRAVANVVLYTPECGPVEYIPAPHWRDMTANEQLAVVGTGGKSRQLPVSKLWIEHPKRRTYDRVIFDPTQLPLTGVPSEAGGQDFNLWPGFAIAPSADGSCDLFLNHLLNVVCCGNIEAYKWVIMWLAAMVRYPNRLPGTALVLLGAQGTGKSVVGYILGKMIGERLHTTVSSPKELTGSFNAHQEGRLLIQVEEAFFAGDKTTIGRLKTMITAPTVRIERKFMDSFSIANFARLLITSNEKWVVPADEGERRFMVLNVSTEHAQDRACFGSMMKQMLDEGGCERLLHHLKNEVAVDWDIISRPLATDALRDQQLQSMDPERRWMFDLLSTCAIPGDESGEGTARADDVYRSYQQFLQNHGAGRRASQESLGHFLRAFGVKRRRKRTDSAGRPYFYDFPPLTECRATFALGLATPPKWDELVSEWQPNDPLFGRYRPYSRVHDVARRASYLDARR